MRALLAFLLVLTPSLSTRAARNFVAASSQRITASSAVVTSPPMTFSCFFRPASLTANATLVGIYNTSVDDGYYLILRGNDAGDPLAATANQATVSSGSATTGTSGITTGVWYHGAAVYVSTSNRSVFLDGAKFTNNTSATPSGLARTTIGAFTAAGTIAFFDGAIAEVGIWNAALADAEIASLAAGVSPLRIRPSALVLYVPLWRDISDYRGGVSLTNYSTTAADDHPRRYR